MKKNSFLLISFVVMLITACKKDVAVENGPSFAQIAVSYKVFGNSPDIVVLLDKDTLGSMKNDGLDLQKLIVKKGKPVTLHILRKTTGDDLLDTTFTPVLKHNFTLFITDLLNVATFYKAAPNSVSLDSNRFVLLNNVKINGVGRKVNFRFFTPEWISTSTLQKYDLVPYAVIMNVAPGEISKPIDILKSHYPTRPTGWTSTADQVQTAAQSVYIKVYDADTDIELIGDLKNSGSSTYGRVISQSTFPGTSTSGGKFKLVNVTTTTTNPLAFTTSFPVYDMP